MTSFLKKKKKAKKKKKKKDFSDLPTLIFLDMSLETNIIFFLALIYIHFLYM